MVEKWKYYSVIFFLFIFLFGFAYYGYQISGFFSDIYEYPDVLNTDDFEQDTEQIAAREPQERVNILLLGVDGWEEEVEEGPTRTDTIMVASIHTETKEVTLLSIPRDSRVNIPGHGPDKVNHAHAFGGVSLTLDTVENFLQIPIHYYARINYCGFIDVVDTLGGIHVDVEPQIAQENQILSGRFGRQLLDGRESLEYVRFRGDPLADIARIQRQQKFIMVAAEESIRFGNIFKIPTLLDVVGRNLRTNMPLGTMLELGQVAKNVDLDEVEGAYLPGDSQMINGISYWVVDEEELADLMKELDLWDDRYFYGETD